MPSNTRSHYPVSKLQANYCKTGVSRGGNQMFFFTTITSITVLGPTQFSVQCVLVALPTWLCKQLTTGLHLVPRLTMSSASFQCLPDVVHSRSGQFRYTSFLFWEYLKFVSCFRIIWCLFLISEISEACVLFQVYLKFVYFIGSVWSLFLVSGVSEVWFLFRE
jgi:hypothetical protein